MPSPEKLGASGRYIEVDLSTADYPLLFAPLFAAKYPDEIGFQAQAVSRTIVATGGSGEILLLGTRGEETEWTLQEAEANSIQATGVSDPGDLTSIKVML
jgi:hypothetical protein